MNEIDFKWKNILFLFITRLIDISMKMIQLTEWYIKNPWRNFNIKNNKIVLKTENKYINNNEYQWIIWIWNYKIF